MADRDPLHDPRAGDVIYVNGKSRTIIYMSAYGKVFYANPAGARKVIDLNSYRKWAAEGTATPGTHPGWAGLNVKVGKAVQAEADLVLEHFAKNFGHPTRDVLIETLLEFGIAVALGGPHSREKVYAAVRRKMKDT